MLISVIVPTRDRPHLLPGALASVRALEGPDLALEVVVGDNGGLPETAMVAAEFGAKHVRAWRPGAAAARNAGLRAATGEYVAFLDDDDRWLPGHLRPQVAWLEAHPAALGAVGQVANVSHDGMEQLGGFWPTDLARDGHLFAAFLAQYPQIGATVIRRGALARVGGFDERLRYDEDWDWHLRLALAGAVGFVPVPCAHFRQRPPGAHDDLQWERLGYFRRVYGRNLRRAFPGRLPPPWQTAMAFARHSGGYHAYFADSAAVHARTGNRAAARRSLLRSFAASPPHALRALARDAAARGIARSLVGS